jgi:hypothetical protein
MSWSFAAVGTPEAVTRALDAQNVGLSGESKAEWLAAKPALAALVAGNCGGVAVRVTASAHGSWREHTKVSGVCTCTVEAIYGWVE